MVSVKMNLLVAFKSTWQVKIRLIRNQLFKWHCLGAFFFRSFLHSFVEALTY